MKFRPYTLLLLATVIGLSACREDPTAEGVGAPEAIVTTRSTASIATGGTLTLTAFAVDKNLHRIPGALTAASTGAAVAIDSVRYEPLLSETRFYLRGTAASSAGTTVTVSGHGLSKDVKVIVS